MNRARAAALLLAVATLTAAPEVDAQQAPDPEAPRLVQNSAPQKRFRGWSGPKPQVDCRCRYRGGRADLGDVLCIQQGSRWVTAQCQMVLNNPTWRVLNDACERPSS